MSKIKIIGPGYPFRGGLAAFNERMALEFRESGYNIEIETFTLQYPAILFPGKTQYSDRDKPVNLEIRRSINSVSPLNWLSVGNRIRKEKPDLVIFRYWLPFMAPCFGTIARRLKKDANIKVLALVDNIIPHEKRVGDTMFTRYFIKPVDGFIIMSESVNTELDRFDSGKPRIYTPHPVFDNFGKPVEKMNAIKNLKLDPDYRYILFFGLIRDYKGLDLLIEAFSDKRLQNLKIKVLIAGEFYSSSKKYYDMIRSRGLDDFFIIHPVFVPDKDVSNWFCAADIIVQPYKSATQSGVTQIGYHFNKPMLVTDVGGLSEIIPHGKGGYVVTPESEAIAESLFDFYYNNRENRFTEGIKKEKVRFSWNILVKNILSLSDQISWSE